MLEQAASGSADAGVDEQAVGGSSDTGLFEQAVSGSSETGVDDSAAGDEPGFASGWNFELNGHLRGDVFAGKTPDYNRAEIKSGYGEFGLKLKVSKAPYGDAFGEVRFQAGYLNDERYLGKPSDSPVQGAKIGEFATRVKLREAYVNAYVGPLSIRFGQQIIVWGRADGINPTNNITPIDMRVRSPEEDDRRLGNLGIRANLSLSPVQVEAIWMPVYSPSYFPEINLADSIRFTNPDYPSTDLAKGTLAGRFHLLFPKFEASVSYLHGFALLPGLSLQSYNMDLTQGPASITLARTAYSQHVVGFDFATTLGGAVGLRGEAAFRYPEEYPRNYPENILDQTYDRSWGERVHIAKPDLQYVLGLDREFGNVMMIAQYLGRYTFKWEKIPAEFDQGPEVDLDNLDQIADQVVGLPDEVIRYFANRELIKKNRLIHNQTEEVQHSASLRVEWKTLHDTLSLVAFAMMNFSTLEWLVYPKIAYNITDAMSVSVGGEVYNGPDDTMFDMIEEVLSAGYAELKISF